MPRPAKKTPQKEGQYFGFREIDPREKTRLVGEVFRSVAPKYDLMNDLMSGGVHRLWKRRFVSMIKPRPAESLLDVAGGTGDIAFLLHKECPTAKITLCDINEAMLRVGRDRAIDRGILHGLDYMVGNAEALPVKSGTVDAYTISFGLRNVTDIDAALREAKRVLKKGGRFFCLEFSKVTLPPLRPLYDLYSFAILPRLGQKIAGDAESYQYLAESIRQFPSQEELVERIQAAGFGKVRYTNLSAGIAAIHQGVKEK